MSFATALGQILAWLKNNWQLKLLALGLALLLWLMIRYNLPVPLSTVPAPGPSPGPQPSLFRTEHRSPSEFRPAAARANPAEPGPRHA
jgi:hypothetical protein